MINIVSFMIILYACISHSEEVDCPFSGCRCINNPLGDDISIDCISTSINSDFPKRTNNSLIYKNISITFLIFYGFEIDVLPNNTFFNLSIKHLHLISTNLRRLDANTFNGTLYLEELVIYGAKIEVIEKDTFEPVKNTLRKLDFSNCSLDTKRMDQISPQLKSLTHLKFLFLAENNLRELKYRWFAALEMLKELNLAKCRIETMPPDVFKSNKLLRVIDLSDNQIETFPSVFTKSYSYRFSLQVLKLSGNFLRVLKSFSDLEELLELDLSNNLIEEIEFHTFQRLINLEHLKLDSNKIRFIENDAFTANTHLRGLFLNNNYLAALPNIQNLIELTTLNVENQNGKLISLSDYSFDTGLFVKSHNNLVVYLRSNAIKNFGHKVFCIRNQTKKTSSGIGAIYIDLAAIQNMDKCLLKQITAAKKSGFPTYVIIDDEEIYDIKNFSKYEGVCNCDYMEFGRLNNIKLIGICQLLNLECNQQLDPQIDKCNKKNEFKCFT